MSGDAAPVVTIAPAQAADVPAILALIRGLAEYEKLAHEAVATEADIRENLFEPRPYAEALIARAGTEPVGLALFFHNYSTFTGRPGLYVEDIFVVPSWRGRGIGKRLFARMAKLAVERRCARMEWAVLDWNTPSIKFYRALGARAMDEWTVQRLTGEALARLALQDRPS
jgi:GNAT superfamily N-acetyltransferase